MKKNIVIAGLLGGIALLASASIVLANPSFFPPPTGTATATTTQAFIAFGVGTTTLSLDTFQIGNNTKDDRAFIAFQFVSSSTVSIPSLNARVEYSNDNQDWYPISNPTNSPATTTGMGEPFSNYSFPLSTTTAATLGNGGTSVVNPGVAATTTDSFVIDTYTRYVRVVFTVPSGGGNGKIWAQIQPIKEVHE